MTVRDYGCCGGATASESAEKQWLRAGWRGRTRFGEAPVQTRFISGATAKPVRPATQPLIWVETLTHAAT